MIPNMPPVSPSSIKTFRACNRKWWWDKIIGVPGKDSPAAMLGTELHQQLEDWLMKRQMPASERIREVLHCFPTPDDYEAGGILVEQWLRNTIGTTKFRGRADVIDIRDPKHPIIYDLKTTGNLKWGLSAKKLKTDLQMNCYGFNTLEKFAPEAKQITFKHVYVQTKNEHNNKVVTAVATYDDAKSYWTSLGPTVAEMVMASAEEWAEAVPMSKDHCYAYVGCAYQSLCGVKKGWSKR